MDELSKAMILATAFGALPEPVNCLEGLLIFQEILRKTKNGSFANDANRAVFLIM
jgi:hypothetical protein